MNCSDPLDKYHTFSKWTPNDVTLKRKTADEIHRFISFQVPDRKAHRLSPAENVVQDRAHSGEQVPVDVKIYLPMIYRAHGFRDLTSGLLSYAFALSP